MTSLNSKRAGGFSRSKGADNVGNLKNHPRFGEKTFGGRPEAEVGGSVKMYLGACAGCQKICEFLTLPTRENPLYCKKCLTKKDYRST